MKTIIVENERGEEWEENEGRRKTLLRMKTEENESSKPENNEDPNV